ncbi:hypothetical protein QP157_15545 [Sphingomonas sp. LR61]|uniref:hypothetical protein n=1 Tax=Sphingomonas sp. LR61 TaxID=3050234 RepID=UPI002FE2793D
MASPWTGIIEDARHYPSPHNSQPIVVRVEDDRTATVFYDLRRGLPAESFGIPFGHVCAGCSWPGSRSSPGRTVSPCRSGWTTPRWTSAGWTARPMTVCTAWAA